MMTCSSPAPAIWALPFLVIRHLCRGFFLAVAVAVLPLLTLIVYRLLFHPLARIPGPKLAALSNVWQAHHVRDGRSCELGKTLHLKYGPVVRVGPNEVWFNSEEAFKEIYRSGNAFEKSDFYLATVLNKPILDWQLNPHFPDTLDLLSEFDAKRYRVQRRLMGPVYLASNMKKFEPAVDGVIKAAISELKALNGAEVDLKQWMHIIAVECLGAVVLSWSPNYIKNRSDGGTSAQSYLGWKRKSVFGLFPTVTKLSFLSRHLSRLFSNAWGVTFKTPKNFKPFFPPVHQRVSKRMSNALRDPPHPNAKKDQRQDLLADLIQLHKTKPEFTEGYLRRLAVTNFGAGHETMCSALTAVMTMIGSHPLVQHRVADEVRGSPAASAFDNAISFRYTQASIKEAQRLHPVIGMSPSRKVPVGGLFLHGQNFPAGTTVGCHPAALHRNPEVFGADADDYNPGRWLQEDDLTKVRVMERINLTWGGGSRSCPGRHLAELVVSKVVPALLGEFDLAITALPEESEMPCYFMAMLTGVKARFMPVHGKTVPQGVLSTADGNTLGTRSSI